MSPRPASAAADRTPAPAAGADLPPLPAALRLSPELRLLVAAGWPAPERWRDHQAGRIAAACADGVDWARFRALIERHRLVVEPETLERALGARLPAGMLEDLRRRKRLACRDALQQAAELGRIHRAFRDRGIELLPMKGVLLSVQLYGDPGMRLARDLDVLVRPERLAEAETLLGGLGYRLTCPDAPLTPRRGRWMVGQWHHFGFTNPARQLVELHWRIQLWRRDEMDWFWQEARAVDALGGSFLMPSDSALCLLLCDHGAKHLWSRVKWLSDLSAFVAQDRRVDWELTVARAVRMDLGRSMTQAGWLLHGLQGLPLPAPWTELMRRERASAALAEAAVDAMQLPEGGQFRLAVRLQRAVYPLRIRRRLGFGTFLKGCLLSTDSFVEFPLPDWLFWLYFPLRPVLWLQHHYLRPLIRRAKPAGAISDLPPLRGRDLDQP